MHGKPGTKWAGTSASTVPEVVSGRFLKPSVKTSGIRRPNRARVRVGDGSGVLGIRVATADPEHTGLHAAATHAVPGPMTSGTPGVVCGAMAVRTRRTSGPVP
ncbi:hypothetical protein [Streptomyces sp. NPDC005731]|uniref:hypothetical protein n=1 Tax=unclassified Streptomyces TaxID=2593676 RepID=UPI0033C4FDD6